MCDIYPDIGDKVMIRDEKDQLRVVTVTDTNIDSSTFTGIIKGRKKPIVFPVTKIVMEGYTCQ